MTPSCFGGMQASVGTFCPLPVFRLYNGAGVGSVATGPPSHDPSSPPGTRAGGLELSLFLPRMESVVSRNIHGRLPQRRGDSRPCARLLRAAKTKVCCCSTSVVGTSWSRHRRFLGEGERKRVQTNCAPGRDGCFLGSMPHPGRVSSRDCLPGHALATHHDVDRQPNHLLRFRFGTAGRSTSNWEP